VKEEKAVFMRIYADISQMTSKKDGGKGNLTVWKKQTEGKT
jgi:hypothetical protein